jgi:hypothetical protein
LCPAPAGTRLERGTGVGLKPGLHRIQGRFDIENLHRARLFRAFHRQMPVFRKEMPGMATKYKILWFVVDMYHRQRYFFICGCNRTVRIQREEPLGGR